MPSCILNSEEQEVNALCTLHLGNSYIYAKLVGKGIPGKENSVTKGRKLHRFRTWCTYLENDEVLCGQDVGVD